MGNQRTFASLAWNGKGKVTRRERFLAEMDAVIPWPRLLRLIEPHYPKAGQGRQPLGLEKMLRIYFLQQWFNLSDPQAEDALYDSESMRRFARVELGDEVVPDETTILRFRHLLEQQGLTQAIFNSITGLLEERRLLLRSGTIVDATIVAAPSSTKNASASRDPEMKQTRKGRNWFFGMKLHVGTDQRGIVHTVRATAASVADITQLPDLLHGQEREVFDDRACRKEADREFLYTRVLRYRINRRPISKAAVEREIASVGVIICRTRAPVSSRRLPAKNARAQLRSKNCADHYRHPVPNRYEGDRVARTGKRVSGCASSSRYHPGDTAAKLQPGWCTST